jgi:hypothetical protein
LHASAPQVFCRSPSRGLGMNHLPQIRQGRFLDGVVFSIVFSA